MEDRFRFRVWNKEEKYMIYNAEAAYDGNNYVFPKYQIEPNANNDGHIHCFSEYLYSFKEYKTMQCTGFRDKNGKLIYEGDIVIEKLTGFKDCIKIVYWIEDTMTGFNLNNEAEYEVISNIYENPELLEVHHV